MRFRPLSEQIILLTGATSGIGLACARRQSKAGVAIHGSVEDVPLDEQRRLFQTNYWGAVNGMLEALRLHRNGTVRQKSLLSAHSYRIVR